MMCTATMLIIITTFHPYGVSSTTDQVCYHDMNICSRSIPAIERASNDKRNYTISGKRTVVSIDAICFNAVGDVTDGS